VSNARYFAHGTDFYRVVYDDGSIDGPYVKPGPARGVGNRATAPRYRVRRTENNELYKEEWFSHKSYKLQKLSAAPVKCNETTEECYPSSAVCFNGHGYGLKWLDVEE